MAKKRKPIKDKKYIPKEYYEGYYWFILHISPYHGPDGWLGDGGHIISKEYWKTKMPDCVKTAIEKHTSVQPLKHTITTSGGYLTKRACSVDDTFNWFISKDIPLLYADGREIKCWRDLRRLWKKATVVDFYGKEIPLGEIDYVKKAQYSGAIYHDHYRDVFHALESYLEPQHRKNLKKLETPGAGQEEEKATLPEDPTIKEITDYLAKVSGRKYSHKTIWAYISELKNVEPIHEKGKRPPQPFRYKTKDTKSKILPHLFKKIKRGRKQNPR